MESGLSPSLVIGTILNVQREEFKQMDQRTKSLMTTQADHMCQEKKEYLLVLKIALMH